MSIYLYTMRAKTANVVIAERIQPVHLLAYSCNAFSSWPRNQMQEKRATARAERFWEGKETPSIFAIGDKFENGNAVRKGWPTGMAYCHDTEWPGEHIGYLKKVRNTWTVVDSYQR